MHLTNDAPHIQILVSPATLEHRLQTLEAQLAQLQQKALLFESSPTAAVLLDVSGAIVSINQRGSALFGSLLPGIPGRQLAQFLAPSSQGTLAVLLNRAQKSGKQQSGEVQVKGRDWLLEVAMHSLPGEDALYHLTLTDITAFKESQRHLLSSSQEQVEQLEATELKLRRAGEELEQVVSLSRQQLQERLSRAVQALTPGEQEAPEHFVVAAEAVLQAQNLLGSLDRYMRARFMRTRTRLVSLEQVWREVLRAAQPQMQGRDIQISKANLPTLEADRQVLQLILKEYLQNALKFTRQREHTQLRLLVEETSGEYRIGLADNGVGFNMRSRDKAFAMFGRLHDPDIYEGTGLGLAVVQRLCERFGSRAWAEAKPDQGATFWFSWPKTPEQK